MTTFLPLSRVEVRVLSFNVAYLIAASAVFVARGNAEFVLYILIMLVLGALILTAHRRVKFPEGVLWALSVWGLLHMAGGLVPVPELWPINGEIRVLYSLWFIPGLLKYDHVIHAYGFGVTTVVCWYGFRSILSDHTAGHSLTAAEASVRPSFGMLTLCAAGGMGFGALNEVIEFIITLCVPDTNIGGYINTGWDLVSNLAGSVLGCLVIRCALSKPQRD